MADQMLARITGSAPLDSFRAQDSTERRS